MKCFIVLAASCMAAQLLYAQDSSYRIKQKPAEAVHIFNSPRAINANTVEMLPKGILEFKVVHNFGDIAGDFGGVKNFFGLDNAADVRIGFQYGISKKFSVAAARYKGAGPVQQLYEGALKYLIVQQRENDPTHPLSVALFGNTVISAMKAGNNPESENYFGNDFSKRISHTLQMMIAKNFGGVSLQLNPTYVHRNFVLPYDEKSLFAMGGVLRVHLGDRYNLLLDYFHTFRNKSSIDSFKTRGIKFYDALGVGFEILTGGHVFHLNFTNATDILENRFLARTITSWGKGEFRWGFTISRDFDLFWKKRNK